MAIRLSRAVQIGALVTGAALFITSMALSSRMECAECTSDADCEQPLRCRPFDDGQPRCVNEAWVCEQGHVQLPGWVHGVLVGVLTVGALAWAWERQVRR